MKVKNPKQPGKDKNSVLDAINVAGKKFDLLNVVEAFVKLHTGSHQKFLVNGSNRLIKISSPKLDKVAREISFYVGQGSFGIPSDIISSTSLKSTHKKKSEESDVIDYYVHLRLPAGSKAGYAILHSIGNINVKSWLSDYLGLHVNNQLAACGLVVSPLCSSLALKTYLKDADVRSIKVSHFETPAGADVADILTDDTIEKTLVLKREGGLGKLSAFIGKGKKRDLLVAISDKDCTDVKAEVSFNGRSRVISLEGSKTPKAKFYLQEPQIKFKDGVPTRESIAKFATELMDDLDNSN
ncbi:hypothetical protein [Stenotrophomonas sp. S39]|uniref:hypothetical protein n=1 Tax=Stenotrophomonas sp. S39 TaxID=2767451 RepID=UPI00190C61BC|nr:hypothetical protein [Stenotrophomonas sp. S39]MBK0053768.1 hypothetical protein [Stenotrophomonas sp. S39]